MISVKIELQTYAMKLDRVKNQVIGVSLFKSPMGRKVGPFLPLYVHPESANANFLRKLEVGCVPHFRMMVFVRHL